MAWVTEYDMTWRSQSDTGDIYIQRDGGSYEYPLNLRRNSLVIDTKLTSWEDQIMGTSCSFTILNDRDDFYELLSLMTISLGQYRVIVTLGAQKIFEGFLNPETVSQKMLKGQDIRLTASGVLRKLEYDHPASVDTLQNRSLINMIDDCLLLTGASYDIWVSCSLQESSSPISSGHTLFNKTGIFTEAFWKNNIERDSAFDIIKKILKPFNCYLYWYDEKWFIEHYEDLSVATKTYVQYATGGTYNHLFGGSEQLTAMTDYSIHSPTVRGQMNTSQTLSVSPGLRKLGIKLNKEQYFNLLNGDLSNVTESDQTFTGTMPSLREWYAFNDYYRSLADAGDKWLDSWNWAGTRYASVFNGIAEGTSILVGLPDASTHTGLTTRFRITGSYGTTLSIKWKYHVGAGPGNPPYHFFAAPEHYEITIRWWLRHDVSDFWFQYNESADTFTTSPTKVVNTFIVSGSDFDTNKWTAEIELVVPIAEALGNSSGLSDELDLVFNLGKETFEDVECGGAANQPADWVFKGDFVATISEDSVDDNLIEGEITTDFLDKKTIAIDLVDGSWNHRNTFNRAAGWGSKTALWGWDSLYDTLARKLLESKFRLYRIARQKMSIDYFLITGAAVFRPLGIWYDDKQSNKEFVLARDSYLVEEDKHRMELWEFDDSETINLV